MTFFDHTQGQDFQDSGTILVHYSLFRIFMTSITTAIHQDA